LALGGKIAPTARLTQEKIAAFTETMRANALSGDTPFRRAYIRAVIDQVGVDDEEIRIVGGGRFSDGWSSAAALLRPECPVLLGSGAPGTIRTSTRQLRS
jgi:hypothetical protein